MADLERVVNDQVSDNIDFKVLFYLFLLCLHYFKDGFYLVLLSASDMMILVLWWNPSVDGAGGLILHSSIRENQLAQTCIHGLNFETITQYF
ncbi:hypothetical protein ACS0TY_027044 [Phlomoides rotata]